MKKRIFYLRERGRDIHLAENPESLICWLDWIGADAIATPDLICLIELCYYPN
jgi:hypothetical protein